MTSEMVSDADGSIRLHKGEAFVVATTIRRGDERCDYPPGDWRLEVGLDPPGTPGQH